MKPKIGTIRVKQGGRSSVMTPLEDYLHLQSIVKMSLRGRRVGAYLNRKSKRHDYSVVFGFECSGIHSGLTDAEIEVALQQLISGTNDFHLGEPMTVHLAAIRSDADRQTHLQGLIEQADATEVQYLLTGDRQRVQELSRLGLREPKRLRIFVTYQRIAGDDSHLDWIDSSLLRVEGFLAALGGEDSRQTIHLQSFLRQSFTTGYIRWEQLIATKLGLSIRPLDEVEMWQHLWERFNFKTPSIPIPQLLVLTEDDLIEEVRSEVHATTLLCADSAFVADRKWIRIRGQYQAVLTFWDKPGGWDGARAQLTYLSSLLDRDTVTDTDIFCQIRAADPLLTRTATQRLTKQANVAADRAAKLRNVDVKAQMNLERSVEAQIELQDNLSFHTAVCIVVRRPTLEALDEACRQIEAYFHRPAWVVRETDLAWRIWLQTLPAVADSLLKMRQGDRRLQYMNAEIPGLLPLVVTHSPDTEGLELVSEHGGTPLFLDLFSKHKNLGIFGTTRCGKSALVSSVLTQALARSIPIVALDYPKPDGTSTFTDYTRFMEARGAYFDVGRESINLFERPRLSALPPDIQRERFEDYKDFLSNILLAMVISTNANEALRQTVRDILSCALARFFADPDILRRYEAAESALLGSADWNAVPTLRDFLRFCTLDNLNNLLVVTEGIQWDAVPKALEQIHLRLTFWLNSKVGRAISSPSSVSTDARLIVFALRQLSQNEDAAILSLVAYSAALRRALEFPASIFFIDESPILFEFPEIAQLVGRIFANGAKSGIRVILSAQDPNTIAESRAGAKIFQNMSARLIGRIERSASRSFKNTFGYPDDLISQCERFFPPAHAIYTRWLLDFGGKYTFCRYYPSYLQLAIVANNTDEQLVRTAFLRRYPDKYEAIALFARCLQQSFISGLPLERIVSERFSVVLPEYRNR